MTSERHTGDAGPTRPASPTAEVEAGRAGGYVAPLAAFGRGDVGRAGGKGANLGELVRAHFPVPPGFVVTTAAYETHLGQGGLADRIPELLAVAADGAAVREALVAAAMPAEVEEAVRAAYRELGAGAVAVRSSATAEDLPEAAFAGQQDTYLNVVGERQLLKAVRDCWASLWTERAIAYRARQGLDPTAAGIAVVVQRMVPAEAAGVLFTANPVTGARDEMVVDASAGLGEAVVAGLVTPDHYVLAKRAGAIKQQEAGRREMVVRPLPGGGVEHTQEPVSEEAPALPRRALRRLARLGAAVERHYGSPQDIEWAWVGGRIALVQARPMTALPEPPPSLNHFQRTLAATSAEMLVVRPYPLDVTTWTTALFQAAARILPPFGDLCVEVDGVVVSFDPSRVRIPRRAAARTALGLIRAARRHDPRDWKADPLLADWQARVAELAGVEPGSLSWAGLFDLLGDVLQLPGQLIDVRFRYMPRAALALGGLNLALRLLRREDDFGALLAGVQTETMASNRALEELAARVRSDPVLAKAFAEHASGELLAVLEDEPAAYAFLEDFWGFLDRFGHRETVSPLLASQPAWLDAPEFVLGLLQGLATEPGAGVSQPVPGPSAAPSPSAEERLLAHPVLRFRPARAAILRLLRTARPFQEQREDSHLYVMKAVPLTRRVLLEFGNRLIEAGVLDDPADVFHFRLEELRPLGDDWPPSPQREAELTALLAQRKAKRAELGSVPVVDPRIFVRAAPAGDALASGMSGSAGVAEGPVRIIEDSSDFAKLAAGDVLVAPYTNPAWTPLFQRSVAVVIDTGSGGSHAAIVAREYGIPAVMGTGDGTSRLHDGQRVRVDGNHGLVLPAGP